MLYVQNMYCKIRKPTQKYLLGYEISALLFLWLGHSMILACSKYISHVKLSQLRSTTKVPSLWCSVADDELWFVRIELALINHSKSGILGMFRLHMTGCDDHVLPHCFCVRTGHSSRAQTSLRNLDYGPQGGVL